MLYSEIIALNALFRQNVPRSKHTSTFIETYTVLEEHTAQ
jgi:hypothetical protein